MSLDTLENAGSGNDGSITAGADGSNARPTIVGSGMVPEDEHSESVASLWLRSFPAGNLLSCLTPQETQRCRVVCREWGQATCSFLAPGELWHCDLESKRRSAVWQQLLLGGITLQPRSNQDCYEKLCESSSAYDSAIRRDVSRTLPQEELFREKGGKGQLALFRLLHALAIRLWDTGYCQSLNFIVATLIGVFPDDETVVFHCALSLLLRYSLVDMYRPKFQKLGVVVWQFDRIVGGFLPKVHAALQRHGVNAEFYAIQWFLTLYASDLSQPIVRRVWDRFLVAGWQVVVQVGLALLYTIQDKLLHLDACQTMSFLKTFIRMNNYNAEELLDMAASFAISHQMLSSLEAAYSWEEDAQLLVVKDLNSGKTNWQVQEACPLAQTVSGCDQDDEILIPRMFDGANRDAPGDEEAPGTVLPFLLHNLDTGKTTVMETAWAEYTQEMKAKATTIANSSAVPLSKSDDVRLLLESPNSATESQAPEPSGRFWIQSIQHQATRRFTR